ncbi:hypothetical protein Back11_34760 [Paenibacillus baekrokdamisoli]|uniref:Uncharacterized protein n=1 Tax=Paenibacillus baekrokdamisoli TaxID=1712516 RepID=A0A3G9J8J2_9BACL|nr:S-layer homology domain-containing protein [Paenibacillus baekrokdamisoli]MBB3070930.1 streptogramin lyase [Paenibacillus baekrokdamisoli]BBH22131.1 hypothetical protein Back11_34760 [Paenibacillus baekrokdamisoli]
MISNKWEYVERYSKKTLLWFITLLLVLPHVSSVSAQSRNWTQYGKPGIASNDFVGSFATPSGVAVDGAGNVYVADTDNNRIQKRDAATGAWSVLNTNAGGPGSGLGEFDHPRAVAVDGEGNVYVADTDNNRIQKLDVSAGLPGEWKTIGNQVSFNHPKGVAVDSADNVYVADTDNNLIRKLEAASNTWIYYTGFSFPRAVAVDGNGNVYVVDSANYRIMKLDVSEGATGNWDWISGGKGNLPGQLNSPSSIAIDRDGNLYVADTQNNRVQKRDATSEAWSDWKKSDGRSGNGPGEFNQPYGVAVDGKGNVYVTDTDNHRIQKLDAADGTWSEWGYQATIAGQGLGEFSSPTGVAMDSQGNLYVTEYDNHRIQKLDMLTGKWRGWGKIGGGSGSGTGEFLNPTGTAVDSKGNVYVADRDNHRIQKLDVSQGTDGEWTVIASGRGSNPGQFEFPNDVAIDRYDNVYVADINNNRIQKLDVSKGSWETIGYGRGKTPGKFKSPSGVAVDGDGNVYVADTDNHRIQKLNLSILQNHPTNWQPGDEWEVIGYGMGSGLGQFYEPYDVTVDVNGNVYVADMSNNRIQMLDVSNGTWREWGKIGGQSGSSPGEFSSPTGVAVDGKGDIYVADFDNHRIQRWVFDRPDAPTNVTATAGNGEATVSFTAPANNGGRAIIGYTVTSSPGGVKASGLSGPIKVSGLTNGTQYTFTVVATNKEGDSVASAASNAVTPMTVPDAPTNVTATAGNGEATVSFTAPTYDGGNAITGYTVIASPGGATASGLSSPIKATGLTNGTAYTFTVVAANGAGNSFPSAASNGVTPYQPSGGGGNGSVPSSPESDDAVVYVNGKQEKAGTTKVTKENGRTVATIIVDGKKLENKLATEGPSPEVSIRTKGGSDVVIGQLQSELIEKMASRQAVLLLQTDKATFRIPTERIDLRSIVDRFGESANLRDIQVQIVVAAAQAQTTTKGNASIVVPPLEFALRAVYNGRTIEIAEFDAYVERLIAIPDGVDPERITTGAANEADGTLRHLPTRIVRLDGKVYAKVNSRTNGLVSLIWNPIEFKDVERHWSKQVVNDMGSRLVVNGDRSGLYRPDQEISRAEFAAILIRGLGLKPELEKSPFGDVDPNSWYAGAIGTASKYRLIRGFADGTARPNDKITREQAMSLMARAMTLTELKEKTSPVAGQALDAFTDAGAISSWARDGIADCLNYGLVTGRNWKELAPEAFITRAEVAVMVQKLLQKSDLI